MKKKEFLKLIADYPDDAEMRIVIQTNTKSLYRNVGYIRSDGETIWIDVMKSLREDSQLVYVNRKRK